MPALETMESTLVALWRASWQASWLILFVLVAQVTLRRWLSPAWRSALWLPVVARLLLPFTPPSAWSLFSLTSQLDTHRAMALHPPAAIEGNAHRSAGLRHGDVEPSYPLQHADSRADGTPATIPPGALFQTAFNDPALGEASLPPVPAATIQASRGSWLPFLFWIWFTGVVFLSTRIGCGACWLSRRIRRHAVVADRRTSELLEESRRVIGTRRVPVLVETDAVDSPALFGLLRPKLLLPTGLIRRLDESELRHVFLHELGHLRRYDLLLNWLAALLQILHWFNPVVWFGFARIRADREFACDALALTPSAGIDRAAYGTTILKLVSDLTPARPVAGLVGISEGKSHLKRRLRNIASYRKPTRRSTVTGTLVLFCLTGVTLTDARTSRSVSELSADAGKPALPQVDSQNQSAAPRSPEPGVQFETRIFKVDVEKLVESHRRLGPADNLTENTPGSDHIVGIPADGEESSLDLLSLPRFFELEDEAATGLSDVTSTNATAQTREAANALRGFLRSADISVMPPNGIDFQPRRGILMVRATPQELDNLTKALEALGGAQRKIELEVRAVELTRTESREMGLDWFVGSTEAKPKGAGVFPGGPGATAPEPAHTPTSAADSGAPVPTYQLNGILTEHQFSVVLGALEQRPDTKIMSLPSVTTSSGQPTRISWITAAGSTVELNCLPVAGSDGYSLDLTLTVDYGGDPRDEVDPAGMTATRASARQAATWRAVVWTGQTAVMGGLISESVSESADETLRRLRNLIVFITPTILDAAGNRVPLPRLFDPDTIPLEATD